MTIGDPRVEIPKILYRASQDIARTSLYEANQSVNRSRLSQEDRVNGDDKSSTLLDISPYIIRSMKCKTKRVLRQCSQN